MLAARVGLRRVRARRRMTAAVTTAELGAALAERPQAVKRARLARTARARRVAVAPAEHRCRRVVAPSVRQGHPTRRWPGKTPAVPVPVGKTRFALPRD